MLGYGEGDGDADPAERASGRRAHHDFPAAIALNDEVGEDGEDKVVDGSACGKNK